MVAGGVAIEGLPDDDPRVFAIAIVGVVQVLAFLSFGITLLRVLARAHRNACAIKGLPLFHSRWAMIVWFWVPVMQLFQPFHAVREVWLTSTPAGRPTVEVPSSFTAWWGTWATAIVMAGFAGRVGETSAGVVLSMLAAIAYVVAAMAATSTVRRLNDLQTASAAKMRDR
jgi:hypothetical protein